MASNRGSLGIYADLIPQVDGFVGQPQWDPSAPIPSMPLTQERLDREVQLAGKLMLLGLAPLLLGVVMLARDFDLILQGQQTSGVIVDFRSGPRGDHAVAAFVVNGRTYRTTSDVAAPNPMYDIGDEVSVRYLPANPERTMIDGLLHVYLFPGLLTALGCALMLIAVGSVVYTRRRAVAQGLRPAPR
jgi:hypothetical protein